MRTMLKSKIHRARVTDSCIDYEGSITIDAELMKKADICEYEKVEVLNLNNTARFSTYVIKGKAGSGDICLNGAAARLVKKGDLVIIVAYDLVEEKDIENYKPHLVFVDGDNKEKVLEKDLEALAF